MAPAEVDSAVEADLAAEDSAAATEDTTADITADFTVAPSSAADFSVPEGIITEATAMAADALAACWAF